MAYVLFFGAIALNLTCVFCKKQNKSIALVSLIMILFVMGFASVKFGDLEVYYTYYQRSNFKLSRFEPGYIFINLFFANLGFNFNQFRIVIFVLCSLILYFATKSITKNYNMVVLLYTITLFYFLTVALRFFIAFTFVVYAASLLMKDKKKNIILFVLLIFVAAQFHASSYIALIYLLCMANGKALKYINIFLTITSLVALSFGFISMIMPNNISLLLSALTRFFPSLLNDGINYLSDFYLTGTYSRHYFIYVFFYLYNCIVSLLAASVLKTHSVLNSTTVSKFNTIVLIHLSLSFLVLASQTFIRLMFIPMFLGFLIFAKMTESDVLKVNTLQIRNIKMSASITKIILISTSLTWFVMLYLIGDLGFNLFWFLSNNML